MTSSRRQSLALLLVDEDVRMIQNNWLTKNKVEGKQKKKPRPRTGRDGWEKKTEKKRGQPRPSRPESKPRTTMLKVFCGLFQNRI